MHARLKAKYEGVWVKRGECGGPEWVEKYECEADIEGYSTEEGKRGLERGS